MQKENPFSLAQISKQYCLDLVKKKKKKKVGTVYCDRARMSITFILRLYHFIFSFKPDIRKKGPDG